MSVVSSGGPVSSRVFRTREMETALMGLPSSQRRVVRKLARALDDRTNIGYYAALDVVAVIGLKIVPNST
jgi:hypothetical protein